MDKRLVGMLGMENVCGCDWIVSEKVGHSSLGNVYCSEPGITYALA